MSTIARLEDYKPADTAEGAWKEIEAADAFFKKTTSEINAAEKWIAIGRRFHELSGTLKRINQHDKSAPGWRQAFANGRFGEMNFATGSKFVTIGGVFAVSGPETAKQLPSGWPILYLLASGFKKHPEKLTLAIRGGETSVQMTERQVKELVSKYVPKKRKTPEKEKPEPKPKPRPPEILADWRLGYTEALAKLEPAKRRTEVHKLFVELLAGLTKQEIIEELKQLIREDVRNVMKRKGEQWTTTDHTRATELSDRTMSIVIGKRGKSK